ncbi:MAG: MFS transporter, partial [Salinibacter sp.]
SLGVFTHWAMNAIVSGVFQVMAGISATLSFSVFCGFMVLQLLWVIFVMPETKEVPLEDIKRKLGIESSGAAASGAGQFDAASASTTSSTDGP